MSAQAIQYRASSTSGVAISKADSDAGPEPCSEWCGRQVKGCLLCCFGPCIRLCSCSAQVAQEPLSETHILERFLQELPTAAQVREKGANIKIQEIIQKALKRDPGLLSIDLLGLTKRDDIRLAVRSLKLDGIMFDSSKEEGSQVISRCAKVANFCQTFPNLTTLDLSGSGIGKVETLHNLDGGLVPSVDCASSCLQNIATNCTKLVILILSHNEITDIALQNLRTLKKLSVVTVYGCRVTEDGAIELKKTLPDVTVLLSAPPSRHPSFHPGPLSLAVADVKEPPT